MQISIFRVTVRFVRDASGRLEDKPKRACLVVARDHDEALAVARNRFTDEAAAGIEIEYGTPAHRGDCVVVEG